MLAELGRQSGVFFDDSEGEVENEGSGSETDLDVEGAESRAHSDMEEDDRLGDQRGGDDGDGVGGAESVEERDAVRGRNPS